MMDAGMTAFDFAAMCRCGKKLSDCNMPAMAQTDAKVLPPPVEPMAYKLDLADAASVWEFAEGVVERDQPLHILVNCADEVLPSFRTGPGGWEQTAGTNHLGPFLLCELLLDQMVGTMRRDEAKSKQLAAIKF